MENGADTAKSLGVNTRSVTLINMTVCSLLAAVSVSFVIISFVGLVAPHIMRKFVGNDYRYLVPVRLWPVRCCLFWLMWWLVWSLHLSFCRLAL